MGKEVDMDIVTTGAGVGEVRVLVTGPSGKVMVARIEETIDGYAAKFTPIEAGPHSLQVPTYLFISAFSSIHLSLYLIFHLNIL